MATLYETLGVERTASLNEIKRQYRVLAFQFHPDRHPGEHRDAMSTKMALISEAYEILSNPEQRTAYDKILDGASTRVRNAPQGPPPPPSTACMMCGSSPSAPLNLRAEQGFIIFRRRMHLTGQFCRECGITMFRMVQNRTLLQGWWGVFSFFANFGSVISNTVARFKLNSLPDPIPSQKQYAVPLPFPAPRGRNIFLRSGIWVTAGAVLLVLFLLGVPHSSNQSSTSGDPFAKGSCVTTKNNHLTGVVSCNTPHNGVVIGTTTNPSYCPTATWFYITEGSTDPNPGRVVCYELAN